MASAQRTATWVIPRAITMTDSDPPECASGRGANLRNAICYHLICFLMRPASPSHGENRGSSPLGSANKNNNLNKVSPLLTDRCLLFVYYPRWQQRNIFVDCCPYRAGENNHNHCIAPQSWSLGRT